MQFGGFIIFPFSLVLLEFLVQKKSTEITIIIISAGAFLLLFHNRERLTIAVVVEHEKNTRIFTAIKHKIEVVGSIHKKRVNCICNVHSLILHSIDYSKSNLQIGPPFS